jgi:hypothetical protein
MPAIAHPSREPSLEAEESARHASLFLNPQKIRRADNLRAPILPHLEYIIVAGDKVLRFADDRTFDDAVVGRIFRDNIYLLRRLDVVGKTRSLLDCRFDLLPRPAELFTGDLIENRIGCQSSPCIPSLLEFASETVKIREYHRFRDASVPKFLFDTRYRRGGNRDHRKSGIWALPEL